jgi:hypothetical protein
MQIESERSPNIEEKKEMSGLKEELIVRSEDPEALFT